jgi:catechol 2,3-dioxygenase-like lactoylglutathione lyase family enzyme
MTQEKQTSMGHVHFNVTDREAHRKLWVDLLGATPTKLGEFDVWVLPNLLIFTRQQDPTGGSKGTIVNHIGLQVKDIEGVVERLKAAGVPIVTQTELSSVRAEGDIAYIESQKTRIVFFMGPDDTKIELSENPSLSTPVANHHIHFYTAEVDKMKAWYIEMFGAVPGKRGTIEAADLPGVNLSFSSSPEPVVGTKGRTIDHIGFEVESLESFCRTLESKGVKFLVPYRTLPDLGVSLAFFTDPWGALIELTEGLGGL